MKVLVWLWLWLALALPARALGQGAPAPSTPRDAPRPAAVAPASSGAATSTAAPTPERAPGEAPAEAPIGAPADEAPHDSDASEPSEPAGASADGEPSDDDASADGDTGEPSDVPAEADASASDSGPRLQSLSCEELARVPGPAVEPGPPIPWDKVRIEGKLIDNRQPLEEIVLGLLRAHKPLGAAGEQKLRAALAELGYHLDAIDAVTDGAGTTLILHVEPRALVRSVDVRTQVDLGVGDILLLKPFRTVVFDDEVARRMRLRVGTYLPVPAAERACEISREEMRIEEYLRSEGFFEATANVEIAFLGAAAARVRVTLRLGPAYGLRVTVARPGTLALSQEEILSYFGRERNCLLTIPVRILCDSRFTEAQFRSELKKLTDKYRERFPAVRINSRTSVERSTKTVEVLLTIDQRRGIEVIFEGHDPVRFPFERLRKLLVFAEGGTANDYEVETSAAAITTYLQGRGYFEARVSWRRERFPVQNGQTVEQVIFRISTGPSRRVRRVDFTFVGNKGQVSTEELTAAIATRPYGSVVRLLAETPPATAQQLVHDAERIARLYKKRGYHNTKIEVAAGPSPESLTSVAMGLAQISTTVSGGGLYVRFLIDEGKPTFITTVEIALPVPGSATGAAEDSRLVGDEQVALCAQLFDELAKDEALGAPRLRAWSKTSGRCLGEAHIRYREDTVEKATDHLRELLRRQGRPDSVVELDSHDPRNLALPLRFRVSGLEQRRLGRIILRGNFRTDSDIILRELGFRPNALLTADLASQGQSRLRATGLFNSVNVTYLNGDGRSHAVVQVEERYDARMQVDLEAGASYLNGQDPNLFTKVRAALPNVWGKGVNFESAATLGTRQVFLDATVRVPSFLIRWSPVTFDTELSAFLRQQDTDRFGSLLTQGLTLASSRSWQRNSAGGRAARALSTGLRYDFRLRDRQVDTIRPAGTDAAEPRIPVTTRTGALAVTFEWEQRVTRKGSLSPLAPEAGFRFAASVSFASPYLLGQDTFLKLGAALQKYWPLGERFLLRTDARYDHGIPLGGEVVLPEVERFFAGGDSTVRGYDEDRLATEIVEEAVPPFDGVTQLRVLAAGGNIRALTSIDGQVRVYKSFAAAMFLDAGVVTNDWRAATLDDIRPGAGMAVRALLPVGAISLEYAVPLRTKLGDDPRGRLHFGFAMRFD